ncbi:MAG TPA: glycoside hydrolase family 15 protein, partial [Thermomicrobiaceae bacterium]|nr:glycoside hydrolase family 15 protein [Thermomicrobiaceae bacterium]
VNAAVERWQEPDCGIWEMRGKPRHFVQSKAACWAAIDKGLRLAEECVRKAPEKEWRKARQEIRDCLEHEGYDEKRGVFVQAIGSKAMDSALLLLPMLDFVAYDDERMVRTTNAIMDELMEDGLLLRYRANDNLPGKEGTFIACSFWLAECLVRQGRITQAREVFERAMSTCSDLGLFPEEYDPKHGMMLGNYPLGLTHLSHIRAAVALANVAETT